MEEGQEFRDTYEVERYLGEGAFAEVYRVRHRFLGRQAMKVFKTPGLTTSEVQEMLGEAVLLSRLGHPNIVRVFDANILNFNGQDFGFFTMEYIPGGSLERFWRSYGAQFIPVQTAVDVIKQVCRGLSLAHSQSPPVIHRDIKPQNILVGYEADGLRARLSDFGLAKQVNPLTLMASARGTRGFKSPEAFDNFNGDSCAGDIWAMGITLYLLLTDKLPFNIPEDSTVISKTNFEQEPIAPSRVNVTCDKSLDRITMKCLALNPNSRYSSASDLLSDLEAWTPRLAVAPTDSTYNAFETSKEVLGPKSPVNEEVARRMASEAVRLAQKTGHLSEAADLMEEAFGKFPELRNEYQGRVKLWRRGISM